MAMFAALIPAAISLIEANKNRNQQKPPSQEANKTAVASAESQGMQIDLGQIFKMFSGNRQA